MSATFTIGASSGAGASTAAGRPAPRTWSDGGGPCAGSSRRPPRGHSPRSTRPGRRGQARRASATGAALFCPESPRPWPPASPAAGPAAGRRLAGFLPPGSRLGSPRPHRPPPPPARPRPAPGFAETSFPESSCRWSLSDPRPFTHENCRGTGIYSFATPTDRIIEVLTVDWTLRTRFEGGETG